MVRANRQQQGVSFDFKPGYPVRHWQASIELRQDCLLPRRFVVVAQAYDGEGTLLQPEEAPWIFSNLFLGPFCYLPTGKAGTVVHLAPWSSHIYASRIALTVAPFTGNEPGVEAIGNALVADLDPLDSREVGARVHTIHALTRGEAR